MSDEVVGQESADVDVDQILSSNSEPSEIAMTAEPAPAPQEFEFTANGKQIKANVDQMKQWAAMGYNYPQRAAELNQKQQEFEKRQQEYEAKFKDYETKYTPYKQIDEFAAKNPEWWQQIQEAYNQKAQASGLPPEISKLKEEILNEIKPVKDFMQNTLSEKQAAKLEQEDKTLTSEIDSIRKQYNSIDFDSPDVEGKSLEMKVLEHAMQMGLDGSKPGHFRTAFRDFYHEQLVGKAQEKGKELVSKNIQKQSKLGFLGETSKPTQGLKKAENVRNKTYEQLTQEALSELNQLQG